MSAPALAPRRGTILSPYHRTPTDLRLQLEREAVVAATEFQTLLRATAMDPDDRVRLETAARDMVVRAMLSTRGG